MDADNLKDIGHISVVVAWLVGCTYWPFLIQILTKFVPDLALFKVDSRRNHARLLALHIWSKCQKYTRSLQHEKYEIRLKDHPNAKMCTSDLTTKLRGECRQVHEAQLKT